MGINKFKIKIVKFSVNIGRNNIIKNGQMQIQIREFRIGGIELIKLEL